MHKRFLTRLFWISCSILGVYFSSQEIIKNKAEEFQLNNNLITTSFNNNLVDSVKFENGKYRVFLIDEDIKGNVYSKNELSEDNITLLNRISFQDVPVATKNHMLNNIDYICEFEQIGEKIYYFKIRNDDTMIENSSLTELEFKVEESFNDKEIKVIKKAIKKNNKNSLKRER